MNVFANTVVTITFKLFDAGNHLIEEAGDPIAYLHGGHSGIFPKIEEALNQAQDTTYENVSTRILRSEYLVAIALQTGRSKDRERVRILREQAKLDMNLLADILRLHQLEEKWKQWTA